MIQTSRLTGLSVCWLCCAAVVTPSLQAADGTGASDTEAMLAEENAEFVVRAMIDTRERLRSGRCEVQGRMSEENPRLGTLVGDLRLMIAFDFDQGFYRFDREAPDRYSLLFDSNGNQLAASRPEEWELRIQRSAYLNRPDLTAHWSSWNPLSIDIYSPGSSHGEGICQPFDVRLLGLVNLYGLQRLQGNDFTKYAAGFVRKLPRIVNMTDGLVKIRYGGVNDVSENERYIWLDANCGYSPVRYQLRSRVRWADGNFRDDWPFHAEGDVTWIEINGVWVPETFRMRDATATGGIVNTWEFAFQWLQVNEPVEPSLFEPTNLTTVFARVTDARLGRSIVVGTTHPPELEQKVTSIATHRKEPFLMNDARWMLVIGNLVILSLIAFYLLFSRSATRSAASTSKSQLD